MCFTGHFDNVGSRVPSPSLSDPLLCHTHTLSLSLSYFLPPTSIAICILMNLGAVSSRSVIPTSCFSLSSCFYILIFLCPPPADSPPLSACFSFSEEAHANSAWTEQHHFIKSSAKHVRRCLLEVVLAQVSFNSFSSAWTASSRSCETAWGFGNERKSTIPGRFHISLAPLLWAT